MAPLQLRLRLLRSVCWLLLIASTWRMWFPLDQDDTSFPVIPFFRWLTGAPFLVDVALSVTLIIALLAEFVVALLELRGRQLPARFQWLTFSSVGFLVPALLLVALDQQRLQVWMYHFLLLTPIFAVRPSDPDPDIASRQKLNWSTSRLLLALTASIYIWSAWSKVDSGFVKDHGADFIDAIMNTIGLSTRFWTPSTKNLAALLLPIGEGLVGITILIPRTRRWGLRISLAMHGCLILAVGPWGMDQKPGVLLWNVFFVIQNALLLRELRGSADDAAPGKSARRRHRARVAVTCLTLLACFAPALRNIGLFDNWPSWAVYAASTRRVLIFVSPRTEASLPLELQSYVDHTHTPAGSDGWGWLRIDQWALAEYDAPAYPQARLQMGVAAAVARRFEPYRQIRVVIGGPRYGFGWLQPPEHIRGQRAIEEFSIRYWFNIEERGR